MKIGLALEDLHRAENDLAHALLRTAERHRTEHEIYHLGRDLARWSHRHIAEIAQLGEHYDVSLDAEPDAESTLAKGMREKAGELLGRRAAPGLLLLRDLREVYTLACGVSVDWELVGQAAQAARDTELLGMVSRCHPDTLRQMRWANTHLKDSAAQVLVS